MSTLTIDGVEHEVSESVADFVAKLGEERDDLLNARERKYVINSPIFGKTRRASHYQRVTIERAVHDTPVAVFQELNKKLNKRGLMLSVAAKEEAQ